jgi:adenylate cyclase
MRRLAAILAADVVGYSRLMGEDEAGTLAALRAHRAEIFDPVIAERGGRLVKLMGDGALVEFPSAVDAVEAALAIQQRVAAGDGSIRLRIGVNLGDIIIDGDDIYGDGVNVASRLERLAEPGGICISSIVHESIGNRIEAEFRDAGAHEVKGIDRPIRVWRWPAEGAARADRAPLALPEKPSIAILPFDNMSSDPEQEFFAEGIAEDIITELSKFRSLFVIARNSSFAFKGQALEVKEVGRRLGVRYVVEGSVRRAGNRVRITAQLIDALDDTHLWAEHYDRELEDIFAVQDEVTHAMPTPSASAPGANRPTAWTPGRAIRGGSGISTSIHPMISGRGLCSWSRLLRVIRSLLRRTPGSPSRSTCRFMTESPQTAKGI